MARSALGRILENTISQVEAITPTVDPEQRWRHIEESRGEEPQQLGGASPRQFQTRDIEAQDLLGVRGGGEREEEWRIILRASYLSGRDLHDQIGADHKQLIEALFPRSTYPATGTWGSLRYRSVEPPESPEDVGNGEVVVRWPVRLIFRYPVTLV